ncbi:MAG: AAA family ATPase [Candidatus Omnitrophica bacterium]|nr:AAA family ATPase [Candidatus Omnitrophota bacterium]
MKIAVTGKGGAGKTTLASALALEFKEQGKQVIIVDCDPDANFSICLGFPLEEEIVPISEMKQLIAERTEVESLDTPSTFFKINPKVDDIPDKFCKIHNGIKLIVMGKVSKAGSGCMCPENTFIKRLISHLVLRKNEVVILDMVAGSEHLGRATAANVDVALIVVEPTQLGVVTAGRIKSLVKELGIRMSFFVGNKIESEQDRDFLLKNLGNEFLGFIHLSESLQANRGVFKFDDNLKVEFDEIFNKLYTLSN